MLLFSVYYAPFFPHILEGWAKKDHPNFLFLFYEDMKSVRRRHQWKIKLIYYFLKDLNRQGPNNNGPAIGRDK